MEHPLSSERIQEIRRTLDTRDTEELLEIWQKNDRAEWTLEAFAAIREILMARNVNLPVQNEYIVETEEEPDTYHNRQRLDRISSWARGLSWLVIVLLVIVLVFDVGYLLPSLSTSGSLPQAVLMVFIYLAIPILSFGFMWVVLQVIAEGIYLFIDIEENTRLAIRSKRKSGA